MKILMLCDFYHESLDTRRSCRAKFYVKHGHAVTVVTSTHESVFDYMADRQDNDRPLRGRTARRRENCPASVPLQHPEPPEGVRADRRSARVGSTRSHLRPRHHVELSGLRSLLQRHPGADDHGLPCGLQQFGQERGVAQSLARRVPQVVSRPGPAVLEQDLSRSCPASATFLHEIYKVPLGEMELLPLGCRYRVGRGRPRERSPARVAGALGISGDDIVIFTGGKLAPAEENRTAAARQSRSRSEFPLHVVVVGDAGAENAHYGEQLIRLAAANPRVSMVGWLNRDDVNRHLAMADLAVFPASQSILWQQAIAMGLPAHCRRHRATRTSPT